MSAIHAIKTPGNKFNPERNLSKATVVCGVKQKRSAMMPKEFIALSEGGRLGRACRKCSRLVK